MKHFDISEWVDLARGTVPAVNRAAMDAHLSSGCARCQSALDFVQRVSTVAQVARRDEPPSDVVRWAKAISAMQRPPRTSLLRLIGQLIYDSLRDPVPGLRAEDRASRHALYEAGSVCLDLRLEHERESGLVTLVGQISDREAPDRPMTGAPALLMGRKDIVAHAACNKFGEFQMEYPPASHLRLCVAVDQAGKRIEVPLGQF
jgi:hypothetical protein